MLLVLDVGNTNTVLFGPTDDCRIFGHVPFHALQIARQFEVVVERNGFTFVSKLVQGAQPDPEHVGAGATDQLGVQPRTGIVLARGSAQVELERDAGRPRRSDAFRRRRIRDPAG